MKNIYSEETCDHEGYVTNNICSKCGAEYESDYEDYAKSLR